MSVGDLASRLKLQHNTAVELANRLEATGLVERTVDPADKRRVWLKVTREGEAKLAALSTAHRDELHRMRPVLRLLLNRLEPD